MDVHWEPASAPSEAPAGTDTAKAAPFTNQEWETLKAQLPEDWREQAKTMGLISPQPSQLGAKVLDIEPVLRLTLERVGLELSLKTVTAMDRAAKALYENRGAPTTSPSAPVDLSAPALHGWEKKLAPYLAMLLGRMVNASARFAPARWAGYSLVLVDGTTDTSPGAETLSARVVYAMRLAEMELVDVLVTNLHGYESIRHFEPTPGELWLGDRYYSNPEDLAWVVDHGADALVRLNRGALPLYNADGACFDLLRALRTLKRPEAQREWTVWVHPQKHDRIQGRLCAKRLSEQDAEKARQRLRREHGSAVTDTMLEVAAWFVVFTTAPRERLSLAQCLALYPLRWQIELEIKREKSIGGLDKLPNFRDDTIATWLYAKLLLQQIARKVVSPEVVLPPAPPSEPSPSAPPSQPSVSKVRQVLRGLTPKIVGEMWRVMSLVYAALHAALFPVHRRDVPEVMSAFLEHLGRENGKKRPKQIAQFLDQIAAGPAG
jgi:hypothetical protein